MSEIKQKPLFIGDSFKPYGKIAAILIISGEKYYMFLDKYKTVSLMPAVSIEMMRSRIKKIL